MNKDLENSKSSPPSSYVSPPAPKRSFENQEKPPLSWNELLRHFAGSTTLHAIPNLVATDKRPIKYMWTLFLVFSCGMCFYLVYQNFDQYYAYDVVTNVELDTEENVEFPTITFCNMQICGFTDYDYSSYLKKYKQDEQDKFGSNQDAIIEDKLRKNNTKTSFFQAKEVFLRKYEDDSLTNVLNKNASFINEMLLSCTIDQKPCDPEEFEFFQLGEFNKCFKYNSGKFSNSTANPIKRVRKFGKNHGFKMELYVGSQNECKSPLSTISGLAVYVHNSTYTLTEEDNALQIQPGRQADIMVERTFISKKEHPYSDCYKSVDSLGKKASHLLLRTIEYSKTYTQQYCLQLCYQDFLIEFCNCYDYPLPGFNLTDKEPCPKFIDSLYNCQYLIKRLFYNGKNDAHCLLECPKECDYIQYDTTVSYIDYPSDEYLDLLKNHLPERKKIMEIKPNEFTKKEIIKESVLAVNVFYPSSSLTRITEEAKTGIIDTVMPNIGGHLGLFLGMSVLTFVEVIELTFEIISNRCLKKRTRK